MPAHCRQHALDAWQKEKQEENHQTHRGDGDKQRIHHAADDFLFELFALR